MNDDLSKMTNDELIEEAIDWLRESQQAKAGDIMFNLGYIQEYLKELSDRCYAEISNDE